MDTNAIIVDYSSTALSDLSSVMPTSMSISGSFGTSQWYNGSIISTPGYFTDSIGSISRNTAELYLVSNNTWLTQSYSNSIMNTLTALYQNCSVPMATQFSYYLPLYNTDLQAIGADADGIYTQSSLIKGNTDTIISQLNNIASSINNKYIDPTVSNDDKTIVTNTIDTMFNLIPNTNNQRYQLDVQSLINQWATRDNLLLLNETDTVQYTDFY